MTSSTTSGTAIADAVVQALHATLDVRDRAIRQTDALRSLPGFDSFQLVEIIDRVEATLDVEFPADAAAADLADVAGLCRLFTRAAAAGGGDGGTHEPAR